MLLIVWMRDCGEASDQESRSCLVVFSVSLHYTWAHKLLLTRLGGANIVCLVRMTCSAGLHTAGVWLPRPVLLHALLHSRAYAIVARASQAVRKTDSKSVFLGARLRRLGCMPRARPNDECKELSRLRSSAKKAPYGPPAAPSLAGR